MPRKPDVDLNQVSDLSGWRESEVGDRRRPMLGATCPLAPPHMRRTFPNPKELRSSTLELLQPSYPDLPSNVERGRFTTGLIAPYCGRTATSPVESTKVPRISIAAHALRKSRSKATRTGGPAMSAINRHYRLVLMVSAFVAGAGGARRPIRACGTSPSARRSPATTYPEDRHRPFTTRLSRASPRLDWSKLYFGTLHLQCQFRDSRHGDRPVGRVAS